MFCLNKPFHLCFLSTVLPGTLAARRDGLVWIPHRGAAGRCAGRDHRHALPSMHGRSSLSPHPKDVVQAHILPSGPCPSSAGGGTEADTPSMMLPHPISLDKHFCASFLYPTSSINLSIIFLLHLTTSRDLILCKNTLFQLATWSVGKIATEVTVFP